MAAAFWGYLDIARLLVEKGADVDARDDTGVTALMNAAWDQRLELVEFLIEKGADVNARDQDGKTALMWTVTRCHKYHDTEDHRIAHR